MTSTRDGATDRGRDDVPELVVLLDDLGRATGTAPKATVHTAHTPRHLAFSAYLFSSAGDLLVTRRAPGKATFPGMWTNSLCGHPGPGEPAVDAIRRRARQELGLAVADEPVLVLPEFAYVAEFEGVVENEWCPVYAAWLASPATAPDPAEVSDVEWVPWTTFSADVLAHRRSVSPWCSAQVLELTSLGPDPAAWPAADPARLPPALRPSLRR